MPKNNLTKKELDKRMLDIWSCRQKGLGNFKTRKELAIKYNVSQTMIRMIEQKSYFYVCYLLDKLEDSGNKKVLSMINKKIKRFKLCSKCKKIKELSDYEFISDVFCLECKNSSEVL